MDDGIRKVLERPFPPELLRQRQGPGGKVFTYAPLQAYLDRLQEAFGGNWSFAITRREQVEDQLLVEGKANEKDNFKFVFDPKLDNALLDRHAKHGEFIDKIFADEAIGRMFRQLMLDTIYKRLAEAKEPTP